MHRCRPTPRTRLAKHPTFHAAANPLPDPVAGKVPPTLHADADMMEVLPKPASNQVPQRLHADADANLQDLFPEPNVISAERENGLRGIMEEHWGNDEGFGEAADDSSKDDEGALTDPGSEDNDDDSAPFAESDVAGISACHFLHREPSKLHGFIVFYYMYKHHLQRHKI